MHYFISRLAAVIMALGIPAAQGVVVFQESFEGTPHYSVQNGGYLDSANSDRFFTTLPKPGSRSAMPSAISMARVFRRPRSRRL